MDEKKLPAGSSRSFFRDLRTKAIFADRVDDQVRVYPNQTLAAHVLGFVGRTSRRIRPTFGQMVGADGIERLMQDKLAGAGGWRGLPKRIAAVAELVALRDQDVEARDGFNVVLTIDSVPATSAGRCARRRHGEAHADEHLRHRGAPADRRNPGDGHAAELSIPTISTGDPAVRRNRVISDVVEPGSTFKIVVVSGALNDRTVTLNDVFDCEHGQFRVRRPACCTTTKSYGLLSVERSSRNLQHRRGEDRDQAGQQTGCTNTCAILASARARAFRCPASRAASCIRTEEVEQSFHRANSDGPRRGRDAAADGHGHVRHCERRPADAARCW